MKKALTNIIIILYVIMAIGVTICLLSYNEYKISEFGNKTLIIIDKDDKNLAYNKGDLIIVGKDNYEKASKGDTVFFYKDRGVKIAEIEQKNDYGEAGITFTVSGNYQIVKEDLIGTSQDVKVISKVGSILKFLESKWGFFFLIVIPSFLAFLNEIKELILELVNNK